MRDSLLDTAIDHFGRHGFEGAGTRAIAEASGTAMSSITYHFGGKQGLYLAAAEHIAGSVNALLGPVLSEITEGGALDRERATEGLVSLLDRFAQMLLSPQTETWSLFIIREQQHPTEAFERLFEIAFKPVMEAFLRLAKIARPDLAEREVRALGVLVWGQAVMLRAGRATVCRLLEVDHIDEAIATLLRERLADNVRSILGDWGPDQGDTR